MSPPEAIFDCARIYRTETPLLILLLERPRGGIFLGHAILCLTLSAMNWATQCAAIIPCLDEAAAIPKVVAGVRRFLPRIYVVDDGSRDESAALAAAAGAEVISHLQPLGKGAALQTGLARAIADGFTWAATLDGDGQHQPDDLPKFQQAAASGMDLVLGNRMSDPAGMPRVRVLVNRWMSRRLSRLAGQPLPDSQCGYRLLRLEAFSSLRFNCRHFEFESEMLLGFARAGHRIGFVPIQSVYRDERSKIRPLQDTVRWFKWYLRAQSPAPLTGSLPGSPLAPELPVVSPTLVQALPDRG